MWLRSFERFFRIKNQPLSEKETQQLALRNWSEELRLVDNVILRTVQLCTAILTEEQVNHTRFDKYVEGYLKKDDVVDPYVEKLLRQSTPGGGAHPAARVVGGPAPAAERPGQAVAHPLRHLQRGGQDPLPRDPAQPPAGPADRQEVQADPRPHQQPGGGRRHPRHREPDPSAGRRPRCSWSSSACCTTWSTPTPSGMPEDEPEEHHPGLLADHLRDAAAARLPGEARAARACDPESGRSTSSTTRSSTACPSS